jgi:putative sterol carrier protein
MMDQDLVNIAKRVANPQMIFMQGKMKIKGNMAAAMKFTPDLIPEDMKFD